MAENKVPRNRHPIALTLAGVVVLLACANFGTKALLLVGFPSFLVLVGIAGGARIPTRVPVRDSLLYIAISLALVAGIVLYAVFGGKRNVDADFRVLLITFAAAVVFVPTLKEYRPSYRQRTFWAALLLFLVLHVAAWAHWLPAEPAGWFLLALPICLAELFVVFVALALAKFPSLHSQSLRVEHTTSTQHNE